MIRPGSGSDARQTTTMPLLNGASQFRQVLYAYFPSFPPTPRIFAAEHRMSAAKSTFSLASVPHDEQVDLLSQALLREYMHKKKFTETLKSFDEENPRDHRTISSRALMSDMLHLQSILPACKSHGIDTIMEALCYYRREKQLAHVAVDDVRRFLLETEAELQEPDPPEESEEDNATSSVHAVNDEDGEETPKKPKKDKKPKTSKKKAVYGGGEGGPEAHEAPTDDHQRKKHKKKDRDGAAETAATHSNGNTEEASKKKKKHHRLKTIEELLEEDSLAKLAMREPNHPRSVVAPLLLATSAAATNSSATSSSASSPSSNPTVGRSDSKTAHGAAAGTRGRAVAVEEEEEDDYRASLRDIKRQQMAAIDEAHAPHSGGDPSDRRGGTAQDDEHRPQRARVVNWNDAKGDSSSPDHGTAPAAALDPTLDASPPRAVVPTTAALGTGPLAGDLGRDLVQALVGTGRRVPPSFLEQGFTFSTEVPYGILQHAGGPCGVLATVQGFIVTDLFYPLDRERAVTAGAEAGMSAVTCARQSEALRFALGTVLSSAARASRGPVRLVTLPPEGSPSPRPGDSTKRMLAWLSHLHVTEVAAAKIGPALIPLLDDPSALGSWVRPQGYGLMLFVLSLVLTRGLKEIASDMDMPAPLIVEHGYCSQELTNLCLSSRATSNVHDSGVTLTGGTAADESSIQLRGFGQRLHVGFLSYLETKKFLRVGDFAKHPFAPVWVVYHESHYSVLFARQLAVDDILGVGGARIVDMWYYDQHGAQDAEIRLTLTKGATGSSGAASGVRRVDGVWVTPFLDDIIRTLPGWQPPEHVHVNWNGTDPLL